MRRRQGVQVLPSDRVVLSSKDPGRAAEEVPPARVSQLRL